MYVNDSILQRAREDNSLLGFFLAQRSGSSALTRWLSHRCFTESQIYFYRFVKDFVHWRDVDLGSLVDKRVYTGFSDFVPRDLAGRPFVAFSTVRHPVARIASLYEVSRRDEKLVYHTLAKTTDFGSFYNGIVADRPYYVQNLCCRRIGGKSRFDVAKAMMEAHFGAVATTDDLVSLSAFLARLLSLDVESMKVQTPDLENYELYLELPAARRILAENAEDLALFEYVRNTKNDLAQPPVSSADGPPSQAIPAPTLSVLAHGKRLVCPICRTDLTSGLEEGGYCKGCRAPARGRSLVQVLDRIRCAPTTAGVEARPLLALAAAGFEFKLLQKWFPKVKSASLYGTYGAEHESGVDVRDLSRYPDGSFCGVTGILLFDYFAEHEQALSEIYRVLAPGGVLFTLILATRVKTGAEPPQITRRIEPRPGYFDYIPAGGVLLNVTVGKDWLMTAMAKAGFEPHNLRLLDEPTGEFCEWFVGFKPEGAEAEVALPAPPVAMAKAPSPRASSSEGMTDAFETIVRARVDPAFGFREVELKLTVPSVPVAGRSASFAEHAPGTRRVVSVLRGGVLVSEDLGLSWTHHALADDRHTDFIHCFTTSAGDHLLQVKSKFDASLRPAEDLGGTVVRYDRTWRKMAQSRAASHHWHGSRAVDEARGVIMFAEYPDNSQKYKADGVATSVNPGVYRSRDGGSSWERVFELRLGEIRHFHTLLADPHRPGRWWLSSGDRAEECRVWISSDDGDSWTDVTNHDVHVPLPEAFLPQKQAIHRYTDLWIGQDEVIWGADDWLGGPKGADDRSTPESRRPGARMYRAPRAFDGAPVLQPRDAGWIGNPVRSITDLGPALLITTEAKRDVLPNPQVYLMAKGGEPLLHQLLAVDIAGGGGSGFTYSRASAVAVDGVMFSFRGGQDLVSRPTRILRWAFKFD